jgi:hypothetical protein
VICFENDTIKNTPDEWTLQKELQSLSLFKSKKIEFDYLDDDSIIIDLSDFRE